MVTDIVSGELWMLWLIEEESLRLNVEGGDNFASPNSLFWINLQSLYKGKT